MNVPFLVKQYLSEDLEQGSFSKIFWYYPLKKEMAELGGIGMFFEVLYGDVEYEVYEQISKRFWDTFSENFYTLDFEQALRKSIQAFTQLLRGFGVEEGLDVNISLFNAQKQGDSYILKIIAFGESDMFVIRHKKVADISQLVPKNKTLRDIKFLEVDLEEGDILLMGNKTLLHNAFESDIIALDSMDEVLQSLNAFKENLFGNKKVFMVAAHSGQNLEKQQEVVEEQKASPFAGFMSGVSSFFGKAASSAKELTGKFQERFTQKKTAKGDVVSQLKAAVESDKPSIPGAVTEQLPKREAKVEKVEELDFVSIADNDDSVASRPTMKKPLSGTSVVAQKPIVEELPEVVTSFAKGMPLQPPEIKSDIPMPVIDEEISTQVTPIIEGSDDRPEIIIGSQPQKDDTLPEIIHSSTKKEEVITQETKVETEETKVAEGRIIDDSTDMDEGMSAMNSEVKKPLIETPSIPDIDEEEESPVQKEPQLRPYSATVIPKKQDAKDFAADFKNRRSPTYKLINAGGILEKITPFIESAKQRVGGFVTKVSGGKFKIGRIFVGQSPKDKKVMYIGVGILVIVLLFLGLFIQGQFVQAGKEKDALTQYDSAINPLQSFFDQNIAQITVEDPNKYLDRCFVEVTTAESKVVAIPDVIKAEENIAKKNEKTKKLAQIKETCTTKYDKINGIVRVKSATLVTDLRVSLGSDANPVDMAIKQGMLVVADKGRKAIYQINPANSSIMKLEDPSGLITDPISVGTGEGIVFACDKTSGVVYTDTQEGFRRIVGLEPGAIGECTTVKGFGKNVYVVPSTRDRVLRSLFTNNAYALPTRYLDGLADVRDLVIDGNIYVLSGGVEKAEVWKFFAGRRDTFALEDTVELQNAVSAYTNPSDSYNIYIYDKAKNQVVGIEKPTARRHPGIGTRVRTFIFENKDMFSDVKDIVVDLRDAREVSMYVLNGSTIWQVTIPRVEAE
jgi:hypothetical protein